MTEKGLPHGTNWDPVQLRERLREHKAEIDRLRSELAEAKAELTKCQKANDSWNDSYCKRHNDSLEARERAERAEARIAELELREKVALGAHKIEWERAERAEARIAELEARLSAP